METKAKSQYRLIPAVVLVESVVLILMFAELVTGSIDSQGLTAVSFPEAATGAMATAGPSIQPAAAVSAVDEWSRGIGP